MLVLCAHHVCPPAEGTGSWRFTISPPGLRRIIRSVRSLGLQFITMREALAGFEDQRNKVVLTFDDGYEDFYQHAFPVLRQEDCPATVFVLPGLYGRTSEFENGAVPTRLLSREQIVEMAGFPGLNIGSHSLRHRRLPTLSREELVTDLETAHTLLAADLGATYVPVLAYPYGHVTPEVVATTRSSPYQNAFTLLRGNWGPSTDPYLVPRFAISRFDSYPLVFWLKCARNRLRAAHLPD